MKHLALHICVLDDVIGEQTMSAATSPSPKKINNIWENTHDTIITWNPLFDAAPNTGIGTCRSSFLCFRW